MFFKKAMMRLKGSDSKLPQVCMYINLNVASIMNRACLSTSYLCKNVRSKGHSLAQTRNSPSSLSSVRNLDYLIIIIVCYSTGLSSNIEGKN